ncbi:MAG: hypothetical protein KJ936_10830 [Proteobacteria bacterium]|nr:hypothetical protein [Pseudomonadota bacterium]MBU2228137.1 hypothetical protein [Pseudomonadota bacterium]MBU2262458.1 hypothetical protein [Pseudomonadota bacterium]
MIVALLNRMELGARIDAVTLPGCREPKIPHSDIVKPMIGLLCMAKPDYEAIEAFREGKTVCRGSSFHFLPALSLLPGPIPAQVDR